MIHPSMAPLPKFISLALVFSSKLKSLGTSKKPRDPHHDKNEFLPRHKAQVPLLEKIVIGSTEINRESLNMVVVSVVLARTMINSPLLISLC